MEVQDQAARDRIRTGVASGMFVEAGAGSGKTTELTNRVVHLVTKENVPITSMVAITFTKAAAGEMRGRIREALSKAQALAKGSQLHALTRAIEDLPLTPIQTIHAFAEKTLRRYGHAIGVPSTFEVLNPALMRTLLQEDWNRRLDHLSDTAEASLLKPLSVVFAADLRANRKVLPALASIREAHVAWPDQAIFESRISDQWKQVCEEVADYERDVMACEDSTEPVVFMAEMFLQLFRGRLQDAHETLPRVLLARECCEWFGLQKSSELEVGAIAKKHWGGVRKARKAAYGVRNALTMVLSIAKGHLAELFLAEMSEFLHGVRRARRAAGQLSFDELVFLLGELVEIPRVAAELQEKYPYLILDEFQDTDSTQTQMLSRLTRELDRTRRSQLFVVGDPKQAIYGFRGADLAQYEAVGKQWLGDRAELSMNFRSQPAVMDWVNATFSSLESSQGRDWSALLPGRPDRGGFVRTFGQAVPEGKAGEIRRVEAAETVSLIASAMAEGLRVETDAASGRAGDDVAEGDREDGSSGRAGDDVAEGDREDVTEGGGEDGSRPLRYGDIAVLVSRRSSLPSLERELRLADIPYRLELGSGIWRTDEAAVLVAALRVILNETDENSVVALLRSLMFACSDAELMQWKQAGGSWRPDMPVPSVLQESRVASAYAVMQGWIAHRTWESPLALLDRVIQDGQWVFAAFAGGRSREFWNRLRYVRAHVVAFLQSGTRSLDEVVDWMTSCMANEGDAKETPVAETDEDAVRVMTMHAAKGLEFPAVFVIGGASLNFKRDSEGVIPHEGGLACSFGGEIATESWIPIAEEKKARDIEEALRLLYVATTRARDYLWVSFWRKTAKNPKPTTTPLPLSQLDEHRPEGTEHDVELLRVTNGPCHASNLQMGSTAEGAVLRNDLGLRDGAELRESLVVGEVAGQIGDVLWLAESRERERAIASRVQEASRPRWLSATARARMLREHDETEHRRRGDSQNSPTVSLLYDAQRDESAAVGMLTGANEEQIHSADLATPDALRFGLAVHLALEWVLDRGRDATSASAIAAKHLAVDSATDRIQKSVELALGSNLIARARVAEAMLCEVPVRSPERDGLVIGGTIDLLFLEAGMWHIVDYKTDHVTSASLASRVEGYAPQLQTYAEALAGCGLTIGSANLLFVSPEMEVAIAERPTITL